MNRVYQSGNVELREEDNGDVVLENTETNETVTLSTSFEEVVAAVNNHTENDVHTQNQPPIPSEVISTIDGSSISPSDISNLWDGTNVTADVDNQSVSTERTRSDTFVDAYSLSARPHQFAPHTDDYRALASILPSNIVTHMGENRAVNYTTYITDFFGNQRIYITGDGGGLDLVAEIDDSIGDVDHVQTVARQRWLLYDSDAQEMLAFNNADQVDDGTIISSFEGVQPFRMQLQNWYDGSQDNGVLWAEYPTTEEVEEVRIIRYEDPQGDTQEDDFETVLTLDYRDASEPSHDHETRHFHSVDVDPWNPSEYYATTGDNDEHVHWFKSTDYGQTWSHLDQASGEQTYRTVQVTFTEDYVWWASDATDEGFYRATRDDLGDPTTIFEWPEDEMLSLGTSLLEIPKGILIAMVDRDEVRAEEEGVPLYFYPLDNAFDESDFPLPARKFELARLPAKGDGSGGINGIAPHQNQVTGRVPATSTGLDLAGKSGAGGTSTGTNTLEFDVVELM